MDVVDTRYAVPYGCPIGIYLKSDGIMVIGTGKLTAADGMEVDPAGILKSGDYIEAFNGKPLLKGRPYGRGEQDGRRGCGGLSPPGRRTGGRQREPVKTEDGQYKLGAWVRDDTQGIGTVTYLDLNGNFGALGHGDQRQRHRRPGGNQQGELYTTQIMGIEKGPLVSQGCFGVIYYGPGSLMGEINQNTNEGIFGTVSKAFLRQTGMEAMVKGNVTLPACRRAPWRSPAART